MSVQQRAEHPNVVSIKHAKLRDLIFFEKKDIRIGTTIEQLGARLDKPNRWVVTKIRGYWNGRNYNPRKHKLDEVNLTADDIIMECVSGTLIGRELTINFTYLRYSALWRLVKR